MLTLRRSLVVVALMFWQGGFTFYASVVVPIAQQEIGHRKQGFITRQVTNYLNLSTAIALLPLAWDVLTPGDPRAFRRRLREFLWIVMATTLVGLLWLHGRMDALLDPDTGHILDSTTFGSYHRQYLWVSTAQWACSLAYVVLMLRAWRAEDGRGPASASSSAR